MIKYRLASDANKECRNLSKLKFMSFVIIIELDKVSVKAISF